LAYTTGTGTTIYDLLEAIDTFITTGLTTATNWVNKSTVLSGSSRKKECIWEGKGTGTDKIYIGARVVLDGGVDIATAGRLELNGFAGFDTALTFDRQPGGITKSALNTTLPTIPMANNSGFTYWIFGNSQRVIIVVKMSTQYESAYLGLFNPVSSERQYAYPMLIAGSACGNMSWLSTSVTAGRGSMVLASSNGQHQKTYSKSFPATVADNNRSNARVRRSDGTWRGIDTTGLEPLLGQVYYPFSPLTMFPYNCNNKKLIASYNPDSSTTNEDFLLFPVMLCESYPQDVLGLLDSVKFVSGTRDIAVEQIIIESGDQYIVFDTLAQRGSNSYFAVKLA